MMANYFRTAAMSAVVLFGGALLAVSCGDKEGGNDGPAPEEGTFASYAENVFYGNGAFTITLSTANTADGGKTFTSTGTVYEIELFAEKAANARDNGAADGTYTLDPDNTKAPGTLSARGTKAYKVVKTNLVFNQSTQQTPITAATVEVSHKDGKLRLAIDITLQDGTHEVFQAKDILMLGNNDKPTTLTADKTLNFSAQTEVLAMWGGFDNVNGSGDWWIHMTSGLPNVDEVILSIYSESDNGSILPTGVYTAGELGENIPGVAGTFRPGSYYPNLHTLYSTFYGTNDAVGRYYSDHAIITKGTITITAVQDGKYKFAFDTTDSNDHKITGEWTGAVTLQ